MNFIANVVKIIHLLLILFIVGTPFSNDEMLLSLHAIILPGIIMHWLTNNNNCSLTQLESTIYGVTPSKTFIGQILNPFFDINDKFIYIIALTLLFVTLLKLEKYEFRILKTTFKILYNMFLSMLNNLYLFIDTITFNAISGILQYR